MPCLLITRINNGLSVRCNRIDSTIRKYVRITQLIYDCVCPNKCDKQLRCADLLNECFVVCVLNSVDTYKNTFDMCTANCSPFLVFLSYKNNFEIFIENAFKAVSSFLY